MNIFLNQYNTTGCCVNRQDVMKLYCNKVYNKKMLPIYMNIYEGGHLHDFSSKYMTYIHLTNECMSFVFNL